MTNLTVNTPFEEIKRLLKLSLLHNDFSFNDQWFLEASGTAMGNKYAPSFANIFMAYLEDKVLNKAKYKPLVTPHRLMITHTIESCWIRCQNKVE